MAAANPSRPGAPQPGTRSTQNPKQISDGKPEVNVAIGTEIVRKPDGTVVERTEFNTGSFRETNVFPGDHDGSKAVKTEISMTAEAMQKAIADGIAEGLKQIAARNVPEPAPVAKKSATKE